MKKRKLVTLMSNSDEKRKLNTHMWKILININFKKKQKSFFG